MDISTVVKHTGQLIRRNSSVILTGVGIAGSVTSAILAVKATPRAVRKLDLAYIEKNDVLSHVLPGPTQLTKREIVKVVWKDYLPAVGVQVVTIGCIIGAQTVNQRRQAALISAFSLSETALREYQERMAVEAPAKDRKVRDEIAQAKVEAHPASGADILLAHNGDQLFYEPHTDRYFYSTMNKVDKAVNDLNFRILNQEYASQNEFYEAIGLKAVSQGDEFGWTADHPLELDKTTVLTDDDRAAVVISFVRNPIANYWKGFR